VSQAPKSRAVERSRWTALVDVVVIGVAVVGVVAAGVAVVGEYMGDCPVTTPNPSLPPALGNSLHLFQSRGKGRGPAKSRS